MSSAIDWTTIKTAIQAWVAAVVLDGYGVTADRVFWAYKGKPRPEAPYIVLSVTQVRGVAHDYLTKEWNYQTVGLSFLPAAVNVAANTITSTAHGLANGTGPIRLTTTGALPGGLALATDYWVIKVDADTIKLASSYKNSAGRQPDGSGNPVTPIDLTSQGTGTHTAGGTEVLIPGHELVIHANGTREITLKLECFVGEGQGTLAMQILSDVIASLSLYVYDLDQAGVGISDMGQSFAQGGVQHLEGQRGSILEPRSMVDLTIYVQSDLTGYQTIIQSIQAELRLESEGGDPLPAISMLIPDDE